MKLDGSFFLISTMDDRVDLLYINLWAQEEGTRPATLPFRCAFLSK